MIKLTTIALLLAACTTDPASSPDANDVPVPPCVSTTGTVCHAVETLAGAECERREKCEGDTTPVLVCMNPIMAQLCEGRDCTAEYTDWPRLDLCNVAYDDATCSSSVTLCPL